MTNGAGNTGVAPQKMEEKLPVAVSVVVPVVERCDDLRALFLDHAKHLSVPFEFIFVVDGSQWSAVPKLKHLVRSYPEVKAVLLNRAFGEATALAVGFEQAKGETIITLSSYFQVLPEGIVRLLKRFKEEDADLSITRRHPRIDSWFNRLQSRVFHALTRALTGQTYQDISCGLRVLKRSVAKEMHLYGDLHRFLPLLAYQKGFKVIEIPLPQSPHDRRPRVYRPGVYLRRLLDILTLFFLFKFTRKPLRFFGLIGSALFGLGVVTTGYLGFYRLLGFGGIAGRPLLLLGVLMVVLGVQLFSIGLLGEMIIFTHASETKDYQLKEILK